MTVFVAADTGGTFSDLAAYDAATGRVVFTKSLTTYGNLVDGVMACLTKVDIDLTDVEMVKFGTTLVINTFVQRNGARTALVTTRGHRDVLELRRGNRPNPFDLRYAPDAPLVDRDHRLTVDERIGGQGEPVRPLDLADLAAVADELERLGVEAIAVSFLNAYLNPAHEVQAAAFLRERFPTMFVTAGSELSREWYEYERTSTAVANAYVGPRLEGFVRRLDAALRAGGFRKTFYLSASNGGVFSVRRALAQPVMLVESGPVGGCIGAELYARELGRDKLIAFDMGGTTAKCAIVENGGFEVKSPYYVGGRAQGFPIRGAVLDIVEVGAGGGSIAALDAQQRLSVGPASAGSDPGPACYGRGGAAPTITDANLLLGRIGAASFLGGEMRLDIEAARHAMRAAIARPLGYDDESGLDDVAWGVLTLGAATMADAIKRITIERGVDPREFALFAFGGGGPLHAVMLARELTIPEVIIPPEPGVFSALGMLLANARIDETRTFLRPLDADTARDLDGAFAAMEAQARVQLRAELDCDDIVFERQATMRFAGQRHAMRTSLAADSDVATLRERFESQYRRRYGFVEPNAPIEFVSLVLTCVARIERPELASFRPTSGKADGTGAPGPIATRSVYFSGAHGRVDSPVFARADLPVGFAGSGPAVIEEYGSSTIVDPGDRFRIGELGEIRVLLAAEGALS